MRRRKNIRTLIPNLICLITFMALILGIASLLFAILHQGPKGDIGIHGINGINGKNGKNGIDGDDGLNASITVSIFNNTNNTITYNVTEYFLVINVTDNVTFIQTPGPPGPPGINGTNGID